MKDQKNKRPTRKGKKHQRPLSLYGMSFDEAVGRLLTAKPKPKARKPKK
jgi:hypothetical protein